MKSLASQRAAALRCGLAVAPAVPPALQRMSGQQGGVEVWVEAHLGRRGPRTVVGAAFGEPLGVGLTIVEQGLLSGALGEATRVAPELRIGAWGADARLRIDAVEVPAAKRLLALPYVGAGLVRLVNGPHGRLRVSDEAVTLDGAGVADDPGVLLLRVDLARDLAARIRAGRMETRDDGLELARRERWSAVASRLGLTWEGEALTGRLEGAHVEVAARYVGDAWHTVFTARFDRSLGVELALLRQGVPSPLAWLIHREDIRVGDPVFDRRFLVRGAPADRVRALLRRDARAALLALQEQAGALRVDDDRISALVGWRVVDPAHLTWGLTAVARAAGALMGLRGPGEGPYRR